MTSPLSDRIRKLKDSESFQSHSRHYKRMLILSEKVYGRRKDLDLSQSELAKKAGTTQRIISQIEQANYAPNDGIGESLYDRLSEALEVDRNYLFSENIDRKTFELFCYLSQKLGPMDKMQWMKLPYFIDYQAVQSLGGQLTNLQYRRYIYGPFDEKLYGYQQIGAPNKITYTYLGPHIQLIDSAIEALPAKNGTQLKKLSYETPPMKALEATLGGKENMNAPLDLSVA